MTDCQTHTLIFFVLLWFFSLLFDIPKHFIFKFEYNFKYMFRIEYSETIDDAFEIVTWSEIHVYTKWFIWLFSFIVPVSVIMRINDYLLVIRSQNFFDFFGYALIHKKETNSA